MNKQLTFIICYRHNIERLKNLKRTLDWMNSFSNCEIILVEQDKTPKVSHLNLPCKYIFIKTNLPFNKSWGFNVGLKYASSDVITFTDSDLIMNQENFIKALNMLSENDMVNPYTSVIDLTPQETNMNMNNILKIDRPGRGENDHQKVPLCGGTCIFRKEAIAKIGGWNEDFIGWGAEDDELSIRVKKYLKWTELKGSCYHLYHSRPAPDPTNYNRNLTLLNKISNLTDQQTQNMIQKMTTKSGMKNKYDI